MKFSTPPHSMNTSADALHLCSCAAVGRDSRSWSGSHAPAQSVPSPPSGHPTATGSHLRVFLSCLWWSRPAVVSHSPEPCSIQRRRHCNSDFRAPRNHSGTLQPFPGTGGSPTFRCAVGLSWDTAASARPDRGQAVSQLSTLCTRPAFVQAALSSPAGFTAQPCST